MNESDKLWAAIKINGEEEKYREAVKAINAGQRAPSPTTSLVIGVSLIVGACILNPTIPNRLMAFIAQQQESLQEQQQEPQSQQYPDWYENHQFDRRTITHE